MGSFRPVSRSNPESLGLNPQGDLVYESFLVLAWPGQKDPDKAPLSCCPSSTLGGERKKPRKWTRDRRPAGPPHSGTRRTCSVRRFMRFEDPGQPS